MKQINLLYSLVLIVFFTINSNAQIIYTEIPVSVDQGQDFHIDFNNDGTAEFNVYTTDHQADYIDYDGNTQANIHALGTNASNWDVPNCVAAGFTVDASNNWIGQGDCSITNWGGGNSSITTDQDEYLAVRFSIGTNTYYGWIRIEVNFENSVTFKDYAYNSTPNTAINTGDTGTQAAVDDIENSNFFSIYPNPVKNTITIDNKTNINISKIEIINLLGKKVKEIKVSDLSNQTIDISELNKGMYLVSILENDKIVSQKKLIVL